jgi:tetratricopeptide (TPR) repeat protein
MLRCGVAMASDNQRLDGWKVIGAHFGRDRTTAIRWANERGMPVRRMPGGKTATVFAYTTELDAWAAGLNETAAVPDAATTAPRRLPADPKIAALFMQGRSAWAQRSGEGMLEAIAAYEAVIAAEPAFAPAYAGLADTYILLSEYGAATYAASYPKAKDAAERALAIDANLASAHRALGSYHFFWARDTVAAGIAFERALEVAPNDVLTHIWYGNALADNGEYAASQQAHDSARLMDVGPLPLELNQAWLMWLSRDSDEGIRRLKSLVARYLDNALARDFLSHALLGEGNLTGYLEHLEARDRLRGLPPPERRATVLNKAMQAAGPTAMIDLAIELSTEDERERPAPDHSWAAYLASSADDRSRLLALLTTAETRGEAWASAWIADRIATRWADDSEITALAKRRPAPRMKKSG